MLWLCTFQMCLIIYVSLLLLTPKILSLEFDPQDNAFLSWAHSHTAFHNLCNYWVCGVPPSSSVDGFPWRESFHFRERTFSKSVTTFDNNNHIWWLLLIWWHLTILKWTVATLCTLTMEIMWLLTLLIVLFFLFAPCICNCVTGFVSSRMKAFKLQMVAQSCRGSFLELLLGAPGSETLNMRVRRICCLTNLGVTPLSLGNIILKEKGQLRG